MTEQEALKSALKKVEAQQENLGGFMDRFDSVLAVSTVLLIICMIFPPFTI